jgi:hypothetical protein
MASRHHYSWLTRGFVHRARTFEECIKEQENWVIAKQTFGRKIRNQLPVMGQLIINQPDEGLQFVEHVIVPKNGISQKGYVNEIWVRGRISKIDIDGASLSPFFGIYQEISICYWNTQVEVHGYRDKRLLLSPKKLKIVPYVNNLY